MAHKIDLHLLACLEALITEAHVTRASERMNMSQPAMSNALGRLRDILGDPLLIRTPGGMRPTAKALEIVAEITPALRCFDRVIASSLPFTPSQSAATFNLMTSDYVAMSLLPDLMALLAHQAPRVQIGVSYSRPMQLREELESGDTSLVIGFYKDLPSYLYSSVIQTDRMVCIAREGNPGVSETLTLSAYLRAQHAYFGGADRSVVSTIERLVDEKLLEMGKQRVLTLKMASVLVLPHIVATTDLLAVLPRRAALLEQARLPITIHELPFELPEFKIAMVWHDRTHREPAQVWLRQTIRDLAARQETPPRLNQIFDRSDDGKEERLLN